MKVFALFFVAIVLSGTIQAQNQDAIRPGDILTITLLNKWRGPISRTVAVRPDGKLNPPLVQGMRPTEAIPVDGVGLDEAAQRLQTSYETLNKMDRVRVVIERGTTVQLLRQPLGR